MCPCCWDTPCICAADLRVKSMEWLLARQKQIQTEIDRRHPKITRMEVELMRFGTASSATGLVYPLTQLVMTAIKNFSEQTIRCEYGQPIVSRLCTIEDQQRMLTIAEDRICGALTAVRLNPDTQTLLADFTSMGPFAEIAARGLAEGTAPLACRTFSNTDAHQGIREIRKLITFDVVPNNACLEYPLPNWKETL